MAQGNIRVAFFSTLAEADSAVRNLLAASFSSDEIAVICPEPLASQCLVGVKRAERPGSQAVTAMVGGSAAGAAIGGVALAAAALATGGVALLPALPVLLGGGALAGGFSALIAADGYGKEIGNYYEEAIRLGQILVGVKVEKPESGDRVELAARILAAAGGAAPTAG